MCSCFPAYSRKSGLSRLPEAESTDIPAPQSQWGRDLIPAAWRRIMMLLTRQGFIFDQWGVVLIGRGEPGSRR